MYNVRKFAFAERNLSFSNCFSSEEFSTVFSLSAVQSELIKKCSNLWKFFCDLLINCMCTNLCIIICYLSVGTLTLTKVLHAFKRNKKLHLIFHTRLKVGNAFCSFCTCKFISALSLQAQHAFQRSRLLTYTPYLLALLLHILKHFAMQYNIKCRFYISNYCVIKKKKKKLMELNSVSTLFFTTHFVCFCLATLHPCCILR